MRRLTRALAASTAALCVLCCRDYRRIPDCGLDEVEERYAELLEALLERWVALRRGSC